MPTELIYSEQIKRAGQVIRNSHCKGCRGLADFNICRKCDIKTAIDTLEEAAKIKEKAGKLTILEYVETLEKNL